MCVLLSLQTVSGKPEPFTAANPSITVLQRDRQIGLSVCTFGCHDAISYHVNLKGDRTRFASSHISQLPLNNIDNHIFVLFTNIDTSSMLDIKVKCYIVCENFFIYRTRMSRKKKSKPMLSRARSTLSPVLSNASSSAEDERWLAHKSYSQMPSERNGGGVGRGD